MSLGPPIRKPPPEVKGEWLKVEGKPHLRRHSITKELKTYIPANEVASPPYGWPNYRPAVPLEPDLVLGDEDGIA
jgi:hypothetical protein